MALRNVKNSPSVSPTPPRKPTFRNSRRVLGLKWDGSSYHRPAVPPVESDMITIPCFLPADLIHFMALLRVCSLP